MATPATAAASAASLATTVVRTTTVFFAISGPLKIEDFEGRGRRKNRTDYSVVLSGTEARQGSLGIEAAAV
jgi:hypothetical protein